MNIWDHFSKVRETMAKAKINEFIITIENYNFGDMETHDTYHVDIFLSHDYDDVQNHINHLSKSPTGKPHSNASKYGLDFLDPYYKKMLTYYDVPINLIERTLEVLLNYQEDSIGGVCAKCGNYDKYACLSINHNNEIRCYLHC